MAFGAGIIFKEGLTVRGLTTAASIWVTAAIGILIGIGFWFAALVGAAATLVVLAVFRFVEASLDARRAVLGKCDGPHGERQGQALGVIEGLI